MELLCSKGSPSTKKKREKAPLKKVVTFICLPPTNTGSAPGDVKQLEEMIPIYNNTYNFHDPYAGYGKLNEKVWLIEIQE